MHRALICFALALAFAMPATLPASAQNNDAVEQRQKLFKSMTPSAKAGKAMLQGRKAFDLATAKKIFENYKDAAEKLEPLFPDDSKTGQSKDGHKTMALPAIWTDKADFDARMKKFKDDAANAVLSVKDAASFKTAWGQVMPSCGGCHKIYRKEHKH